MIELYFSMFFSFAYEMIAAFLLIIPRKNKFRSYPYLRIPASLILVFGTSYLLYYLTTSAIEWSIWWNIGIYSIYVVVLFFAFYNVYRYGAKELLLITIMAYSFQHVAYQVNNLVLYSGLSNLYYRTFVEDNAWIAKMLEWISKVLILALTYVGLYFLSARNYGKVAVLVRKSIMVIPFSAVVYALIIVANAYVSNYTVFDWMKELKIVLSFVFIFIAMTFQFVIIYGFRYASMQRDMAVLESTLKIKFDEHIKNEQNIKFINMKCHDLRKKVRMMKQKQTFCKEDLDLLEQSLYFFDTGIRTGDNNIDALIQEKQLYCRANKIEFTTLIDGAAFSEMDFSDVYFLFMNIIDNAIEATEKLSDESLRTISLTASKTKGVIVIECSNYFEGERKISKDGRLLTTKEDKALHGYGGQSVEYIVRKYNGTASYDIEGNVFTCKIVI